LKLAQTSVAKSRPSVLSGLIYFVDFVLYVFLVKDAQKKWPGLRL